jgi:hypothetical protein
MISHPDANATQMPFQMPARERRAFGLEGLDEKPAFMNNVNNSL